MGGVAQRPADDEERKRKKKAFGIKESSDGFLEKLRRRFKGDKADETAKESEAGPGTSGEQS